MIVCVIALAIAVPPALRHAREVPPPPPPPIRLSITAPPGAELGSGDDVLDAAISPDGQEIVFVATADGVTRLWRRLLSEEQGVPLDGTEGASMPAFHPAGRIVAFFAGGRLKQISLLDREVRELAAAPAPAGATWLPDGSLLFVPDMRGPVRRLEQGATSDATRLRPGERGHGFPAAAGPDSFAYVATLDNGRRVVRLVGAEGERDLTATSSHVEFVGDQLVHVRDDTLLTRRFDPERSALDTQARPLAFDVGVSSSGRGFFAAAPGLVVWAAAAPRDRDLVWFDLEGSRLDTVAEPADYRQVRLSPNDREAAVTRLDPLLRTLDIFILRLAGRTPPEQLTLALGADTDPVWSPRGDRVLFRSLQAGSANLFVRRTHEPDAPIEPLFGSEHDKTPSDWREGTILFHAPGAATIEVWGHDVARGTQMAATRRGFNTFDARWSPDGRRIAYASDESGRSDIYVEPWPPTGARIRASFGGGSKPRWGRDGGSLFFLREGHLWRTEIDGGRATPVVDDGQIRDFALAHRSDRVLVILPRARAEQPGARVLLNWMPAQSAESAAP